MTNSLLDLKSLSRAGLERIFFLAREIKRSPLKPEFSGKTAALLFFEPSTRTRMSFEAACYRCGLGPLVFQAGSGSSMEKGETIEDTLLNLAAMKPSVMVIRAGDELKFSEVSKQLSIPVINAGWGKLGHPTQALLDLFALHERRSLDGMKILFVGDITHSRVVASHFEVLPLFNAEIGVCGPEALLPKNPSFRKFEKVSDAFGWADVIVTLRYQLERHSNNLADAKKEIRSKFALTKEHLKTLPESTLILHPGPVNQGVELDPEVYHDSRSMILDQVSHGVWLREALLRIVLSEVNMKEDWS